MLTASLPYTTGPVAITLKAHTGFAVKDAHNLIVVRYVLPKRPVHAPLPTAGRPPYSLSQNMEVFLPASGREKNAP